MQLAPSLLLQKFSCIVKAAFEICQTCRLPPQSSKTFAISDYGSAEADVAYAFDMWQTLQDM